MTETYEITIYRYSGQPAGDGVAASEEILTVRGAREVVLAAVPMIGTALGTPLAAASASVEPASPTEPPAAPKRGPGRPRKNPTSAAAEPSGVVTENVPDAPGPLAQAGIAAGVAAEQAQPANAQPAAATAEVGNPNAQPAAAWDPFAPKG